MNKLAELYMNDKRVINDYLDNNHNLPSAVIDALLIRLASLKDFIKMLDETEEIDNLNLEGEDMSDVDNGEDDPDVEVSGEQ